MLRGPTLEPANQAMTTDAALHRAELSVIVPVLNEADNIAPLLARLTPILERSAASHEVIFVDDGSTDATVESIGRAHALDARVGVAVAAFFPRITLTGAAGFESATVTDLFNWQSHLWQIGPSINLPIFEGFRNQANLQAAHARYDQSVAQYRQQVLVAFQDVENALADLRTLAAQSEQQNLAVEASRRTLQLSQDQYHNGAVTFLDVVDAERTVFDSERTSAQLLGQRLQATVQLIKALGGGWG